MSKRISRPLSACLLLLFSASPCLAQRLKVPVALEHLKAVAVADSNDATAHYNLALGYWSKKKWDEADLAFRAALELDPRHAPAHLGLGTLPYARRKKLRSEVEEERVPAEWRPVVEEAAQHLRHAFVIDPLVDLRLVGASVPARSVHWEHNPYLKALWDEWLGGFDDLLRGEHENAYRRLNRMVEDMNGRRYPSRVPAITWWYLGLAAAQVGRYEDAELAIGTLLERSLETESDESELVHVPLLTAEYRFLLGVLRQQQGDMEGATELYRRALEGNLGLYMAHVRLAAIHEGLGDLATAAEERRRAVNANPEDHTLLIELGATLFKNGELDAAQEALETAVRMGPRDARPHYALALIAERKGDAPAARAAYERFVELAPARLQPLVARAAGRMEATR